MPETPTIPPKKELNDGTSGRVQSEFDKNTCPTGAKVNNEELVTVNIRLAKFHGDWDYSVRPVTSRIRKLKRRLSG